MYHITGKVERSLGPRSTETECIKADHDRHRERLANRITTLNRRIEDMSRANRAAGHLKKVDSTFAAPRNGFRAVNDEGDCVDLIRPFENREARSTVGKIGDANDDLEAAAIEGLQWLVHKELSALPAEWVQAAGMLSDAV